ncbi:HAD-IA family hydrolase [Streptomyces sp. NA04227]|uniref:HAD-IA family hydrolase n=1 Tax=Streptomyces sp. NA04227 TaxID=2742136 RepID=UPI0015920600|nr:HAD-IA family hydrolase [Streptomyces sp. NA04227]QKW05021.1 HAD-IA family hydrolase [Streptomyces sp. NA04227]
MTASAGELAVVWCDFGGVLTPPVDEAFARVVRAAEVPADALSAAVEAVAAEMGLAGIAPLELGLLDQTEWGRRVTAALAPRWRPRVDLGRFGDHFYYDGRALDVTLFDHLAVLRARGLRTGLLTNSVLEWEPHRAAMFAAAGRSEALFDAVLRSHEVGLAKPDEALFALAETTFAASPEQCLLIDDLESNCAAARRRGWTAVTHVDAARTIKALDQLVPGGH